MVRFGSIVSLVALSACVHLCRENRKPTTSEPDEQQAHVVETDAIMTGLQRLELGRI